MRALVDFSIFLLVLAFFVVRSHAKSIGSSNMTVDKNEVRSQNKTVAIFETKTFDNLILGRNRNNSIE